MNLLQLSSSDRSLQSWLPSHLHLPWMHSPFAHSNSWTPHRDAGFCLPTQFTGHSSDPSAQSSSPSQRHREGTHTELLHWKDPGLQVGLEQDFSSEPSEQSLSLSQTKARDMHWPFAQRNSSFLHCFAAVAKKKRELAKCGEKFGKRILKPKSSNHHVYDLFKNKWCMK